MCIRDRLITDAQATHFVQKIVQNFSLSHLDFIYEVIIASFVHMANHQYGLCVLKAIMTKVKEDERRVHEIIDLLTKSTDQLVQDQYGNYAIQHAFDIYPSYKLSGVLDKVLAKISQLSIHKFSSNVVEVGISIESEKSRFINALSAPLVIVELMKNKYGNFVLQRALKEAGPEEYQALLNAVRENLASVNVKKFRDKWEKFLRDRPDRASISLYFKDPGTKQANDPLIKYL
eukprot:TRINITY_DN7378_c0_g1_i3.p1 TRINITY_DN7378_c0_g1~~TRINITY_DN7378_c0_g1_i3.p1  ORF type:complete len:252 (-),score=49.14 TRINITY_DN7378_c0_g1_i3:65-760(-)